MNRKLIRTTLAEIRERNDREPPPRQRGGGGAASAGASTDAGGAAASASTTQQRKRIPPEQTNAEAFYYKKQMDNRTPMVLVLQDGEELHGVIEWYDRSCIKIHREGAPNLLVLKHNIKYLYKESDDEGDNGHETEGDVE